MRIEIANRVKQIPPYIFAELEKIINSKRKQGLKIISLSIGDPDLPPPPFVLKALKEESSNPKNHNYSFSQGEPNFRRAIADWYKVRFGVDLDPKSEVIALIGSKEGLANIARAFINPGDRVLLPNPAYPVYTNGATLLSEGIPIQMPLIEVNEFKPNLNIVNEKKIKMIFLNYPNNPTGSVIDKKALKPIIEFARKNNSIVCYDNAYSEITFDGYKAPSILEVSGAKEVAVEFHSCSKTFNMTGDRIGFAVGNAKIIDGLLKIKKQVDSGPPIYIQNVAAKALMSYNSSEAPKYVKKTVDTYAERRDILVKKLQLSGLKCIKPLGTFYLWVKCNGSSFNFCQNLLDEGVVVTPGIGFGTYGEGYIRFSVTQPKEKIIEACQRIAIALEN